MKKSKNIPFNPYKGDISSIFFINRNNQWELKKGQFKGVTIPQLIKEHGVDKVLDFLYSLWENEDCQGIERMQVKQIISEIKKIDSLNFL